MSRLYESLKRAEMEQRSPGELGQEPVHPANFLKGLSIEPVELEGTSTSSIYVAPGSRLVAVADPKGLSAEKFRALATRLENLRNERDLKSLLVTSSVINEGKTLVTGNLAVTLAKQSGVRVLLVEGDLHRPALASLLGLTRLRGLTHWWSGHDDNIAPYICKLEHLPLWFLSAGESYDHPSQILQSPRFAETFARLAGSFDWIIVDSTPLLPTVDVNLWARLVDGMLLVVRAGVTPVKALKKGLATLDNPKLVGVVLNEAMDFDQTKYSDQYCIPIDAKNSSNGKKTKP
jgi:capsular exopolysaccharide synthesis family protein